MRRLLPLLALFAGCTFPDPVIDYNIGLDTGVIDDASGAETADATDDTSAEDTGQGDATTDADGATDGMTDTTPEVEVCETGDPCDCDGDGDKKPGPGCGGNDCDDGDPRRNSKVTSLQSHDATGTTHGGDWNCDGGVEREISQTGFACGGLSIGGTACTAAVGYKEAAPVCGKTATKITCKVAIAVCVVDKETPVTVLCK